MSKFKFLRSFSKEVGNTTYVADQKAINDNPLVRPSELDTIIKMTKTP